MEDFKQCDLCRAKLCGFSPPVDLTPTTALLPCLHAFCPNCKTKCEQASANQQTLICEVCHTECLRSHVLTLPNTSEYTIRRCESAVCPDKQQATTKCIVCNEALCADCSLAHQRVTATSSHFLQTLSPMIPKCVRCPLHSNMKIISLCQCGSYVCMTCVASRLHEGPSHMTTPLSHLPNVHVDESKIMSSTTREVTHIDCSLSMIQVRKNGLGERVANLKKEVGNQVVHICQAVMRRGNDLLRALDAVQFYKGQEYDKLRNELLLQRKRFSRINSYASHIKDFDDLTALVIMRQFLEKCIIVIKAKKVSSERSLNGLQHPATVQFKPDTEHVLANISQWGRIFAEVDDLGTLKAVEVTPTPLSSNLIDVPLFDTAANRSRGSCSVANTCTQRAYRSGPVGHSRLLQQQQIHVQELAARQMQNTRRQGLPQSQPQLQFPGCLLAESHQRPGSLHLAGPRFSNPYVSALTASERTYVSPCTFSAGQFLPYASQRVFLPTSMPAQQPSTSNSVEACIDTHRISNVQLTSSHSGSNLSGTSCAPRTSASSPVRRTCDSLVQTNRLGAVHHLPIPTSTFSFTSTAQIVPSSSAFAADIQPANSSDSPIRTHSSSTFALQDKSGVRFNSPVSSIGVSSSTEQKSAAVNCGSLASVCVSSPPPKDPEPAPLKITVNIKKSRNDEIVRMANGFKTSLDQSKLPDPKQMKIGIEQQFQAGSSADNDESRWDDYCYVCQQGCDEKTGSLGCCSRCPRVFHNICHIPAIKEQMENLPDEWACTLCTEAEPLNENGGTMGQRERLLCSKVLLSCYEKHLDVEPFSQPVPRTVVKYHLIIKQPMDFLTIARRLKEKSKDAFTDVAQFIQCMNLVFENCSAFNAPGDEVAKAGRSVYQKYSRAVKEYLPCMKNQVWLYVNRYSENRHAGIMQKEQNAQTSSSAVRVQGRSEEPVAKKLRKEVKSEFSDTA